jgi:hypothetical protein
LSITLGSEAGELGIPTSMTYLALSSEKSIPSLTEPLHTLTSIAPDPEPDLI